MAQLAMRVLLVGSSTHWAFNVTMEAKAKNSKDSFFISTFFTLIVAAKLEKIVSLQQKSVIMEEKFTQEEKIAVASVLFNLADADFQSHKSEKECLEACLKELEFDTKGFVPIPKNELQKQAYETLKRMEIGKKRTFSRMMTQLSRADDHFGPRERAFVKEILVMCDVPFVHK